MDTIPPTIGTAILFITSGGNPAQIQKAKDVVKYAVIGFAIALLGGGLIDLVLYIIGGAGKAC